jgi:hypothetical protein
MKRRLALHAPSCALGLLLASCSGHGDSTGTTAQATYPGADLGMPPVADGFVRYETDPVMVPAGKDVMWEQWVAPPIDSDKDVIAVSGLQTKGGHHALLLATTNAMPVGTSRAWQDADQLTTRTVGAVGGDGGDANLLPAGVVFRVAKGSALLIQSHYINTSAEPIEGRSVIDLKLGPVDPTAQVASLFGNTTLNVAIPPGMHSVDVTCKVQSDLRMLMYSNHMHDLGFSASTELIAADGTTTPLKVDPTWDPAWAFHPNYTTFTLQAPQVIPAGSTLHTKCTWTNTKSTTVSFPDEMCVFAGYQLGDTDVSCIDGLWE